MPKMGYDMREGTVVRWYKREGEAVARGEVIADIETDKATVEFEAYTAGVVQRLVAAEGTPVPVGEAIAVIREPGEIAAVPTPAAAVETAAGQVAVAADAGETAAAAADGVEMAAAAPVRVDGEVRASPLARRLARERGIELGLIAGSGPGGRIVEKDVLEYGAAAVASVPGVGDGAVVSATTAAAGGWVLASPLARRLAREQGVELGLIAGSGPGGRVVERDVLGYAAAVAEAAATAERAAVAAEVSAAAEVVPVEGEAAAELVAGDTGVEREVAAVDVVVVEAMPSMVDVVEVVEEAAVVEGAVAGERADTADGIVAGMATTVAIEDDGAATVEVAVVETVAEPVGDAVEGRVGLSRMRQAIARVTGDSKRDAPHFYLTAEVDMGKTMSLRRDINDALPAEQRVSVNDLVVRACAIGLGRHPKFNAFFRGDSLQYNAAVNIGIAITLESGLIVPGISHCESKSLVEIAAASKDLIARAQRGALRQEEYGDTTFSVSNLGMFAVDSFAAIIFPPHAAVLAVGTVKEQPVVRDGQLAVGQVMQATLSTDHRVADGAEAAQFLVEVKELLENPVSLLL